VRLLRRPRARRVSKPVMSSGFVTTRLGRPSLPAENSEGALGERAPSEHFAPLSCRRISVTINRSPALTSANEAIERDA
jgi:hypothetical protein